MWGKRGAQRRMAISTESQWKGGERGPTWQRGRRTLSSPDAGGQVEGMARVHPSAVYPLPGRPCSLALVKGRARCLFLCLCCGARHHRCAPLPPRRPSLPPPWPPSLWPRLCPAPTLCRTPCRTRTRTRTRFSLRSPASSSASNCLANLCTSACPALPPPHWLPLVLATPLPLRNPLKVLPPPPSPRSVLCIPLSPHAHRFSALLFCWRYCRRFCILTHQFRRCMYNSVHSQRKEDERSK